MEIEVPEKQKMDVYVCPDTRKTFTRKRDFVRHRKKFLKEKAEQERQQRKADAYRRKLEKKQAELEHIRHATSLSDIQTRLLEYAAKRGVKVLTFGHWFTGDPIEVSNTHGAPIGGVTNWRGEKGKPRNYSGWRASVSGNMTAGPDYRDHWGNKNQHAYFSDFMRNIPFIHTGSGGGGQRFSYDLYIFIQDFPVIQAKYEKLEEMRRHQTSMDEELGELIRIAVARDKKSKDLRIKKKTAREIVRRAEKFHQQAEQTLSRCHHEMALQEGKVGSKVKDKNWEQLRKKHGLDDEKFKGVAKVLS